MCSNEAREKRNAELRKVSATFKTKLDRLEDKLQRESRELDEDRAEYSQRRMEEMGTHAENVLGLFSRRRSRKLSSSLSKRRMTQKAKADIDESLDAIEDIEADIAELQNEQNEVLEEIKERWGEIANESEEIGVLPYKKDISIDLFGVAWFPYYVAQIDEQMMELPGYYLK